MCVRIRQKGKLSDYFNAMELGPVSVTAAGYVPQENVSPGSKPLVLHGMVGASEMTACLHWGYKPRSYALEFEHNVRDRKSVVAGKSESVRVDLGGSGFNKKK